MRSIKLLINEIILNGLKFIFHPFLLNVYPIIFELIYYQKNNINFNSNTFFINISISLFSFFLSPYICSSIIIEIISKKLNDKDLLFLDKYFKYIDIQYIFIHFILITSFYWVFKIFVTNDLPLTYSYVSFIFYNSFYYIVSFYIIIKNEFISNVKCFINERLKKLENEINNVDLSSNFRHISIDYIKPLKSIDLEEEIKKDWDKYTIEYNDENSFNTAFLSLIFTIIFCVSYFIL